MQSPDFRFPRFGYKNTKKLHFLVIPRGKERDHRNWTYDRAFELLSGSGMGGGGGGAELEQ